MQIIENNILKVTINEKGALLTSIIDKRNDEELLYQVQENSWPFQDVVIFPVIGATNYTLNNKEISSPTRHGFIRNMIFEVSDKTKESVTLKVTSTEETLALYPTHFEFYITYSVIKDELKVNTKVVNLDKEAMYFMYGSHSAIKASSTKGTINFDKPYIQHKLINGLIEESGTLIKDKTINLSKDYFKAEDTVIIENKFNEIVVKNGFNHDVIYTFDAPLLAIWSRSDNGEFVCVEPWWGISNVYNEVTPLENTHFINKIKKEKEFNYSLRFQLN